MSAGWTTPSAGAVVPPVGPRRALVSDLARAAIEAHAVAAYPDEACGLLVGARWRVDAWRIEDAIPCANCASSSERGHSFVLDPHALIAARRSLRDTDEVLGFFHSHPNQRPVPSASDERYMRLWPHTLWLIVGVKGGVPGDTRGWCVDPGEPAVIREVPIETSRAFGETDRDGR